MSKKVVVLKKSGRSISEQGKTLARCEVTCKRDCQSGMFLAHYEVDTRQIRIRRQMDPIPLSPASHCDSSHPSTRKGKWATVAEKISSEGFLTGLSDQLQASSKEFRESFLSRDE